MTLSRKDYKAIAQILHDQGDAFVRGDDGFHLLEILAHNLAWYFEQDNPRFDREKFIEACRYESEEEEEE